MPTPATTAQTTAAQPAVTPPPPAGPTSNPPAGGRWTWTANGWQPVPDPAPITKE